MDSIHQRFLQAEEDFLLAAQLGTQSLSDFAERWQSLQSDWELCIHEADHNTRRLAEGVATRIEKLAGDFFAFESQALSLKDDLLNSIEDAFASLSLEDPVDALTGLVPETSSRVFESPLPDHDAVSPSQWLLQNLHNPYPLPHLQFSAGRTAGSKHIKDWFSKARQRIGWTRLLRDRFAGCRSLAADAAFRAFVRDDPKNPLDSDLKTAFLAIKSHAELVYGGEDSTPCISSKRPRSISPTPSLTSSSSSEDSDGEQYFVPLPRSTSKRPLKRASPDSPDIRSPKRRRSHESPSPPQLRNQAITSLLHADPPSLPPKKRCLSESDSSSSRSKRPRGMEGGRLHAVSDPLTLPTVPTWLDFDQSFQIPNPASTDPLGSSVFDLDFFNPPPLPSCAIPSVPISSADIAVPTSDFSTLFEIPQLDLSQPGLPTYDTDWTEFLNFEPDFSLFPYSPSSASSLANTPPLVDDTILSPSPDSDPSSPYLLPGILPHLNKKDIQFPTAGEPIIEGQYFLPHPGEEARIPCATALLLTY